MDKAKKMALAEFMTTKYCHDLAGPIGAISNGVEFLKDGGEAMREQSLELLEASAKEAVARLLFFRQAFGATNKNIDVEMSHITEVSQNFFDQKHIVISWQVDELFATLSGEARHQLVKMVLNVMMAASNVVIYGANMQVEINVGQKQQSILVRLENDRLKEDPVIEGVLCDLEHVPEMDSRNVQLYFTQELIAQLGMQASVSQSKGVFEVKISR